MSTSSQLFSARRMIAAYSNGWSSEDHDQEDYKNAISCLNKLQSNASSIKESVVSGTAGQDVKFKDTITYLERSGLTLNDLDRLSVIHVSGTKGKGTTCALTETLLRSYGVKTGFFSSPHLISVTERIRINGVPISEKMFTKYFWKVWNNLENGKNEMPAYFKFLTILCFHIFLEEKVEAAILEVGIGGEYDSTNIVRNTKTVGITSLGLEHTNILGNTLEEIAWQKAGIIKESSNVFTSVDQDVCLEVIKDRCKEKKAKFTKVPSFDMSSWNLKEVVEINAPLAVHLTFDWLKRNKFEKLNGMTPHVLDGNLQKLLPNVRKLLENFQFPGRCQYLRIKNLNIYLDGAHTVESINLSSNWFKKSTKTSQNDKFMIFNLTGEREATKLLKVIESKSEFSLLCFTPNTPFIDGEDLNVNNQTAQSEVEKLRKVQEIAENCRNRILSKSIVFPSILDCLRHISELDNNNETDVFVTGSIHLIGATLLALEEFSKK